MSPATSNDSAASPARRIAVASLILISFTFASRLLGVVRDAVISGKFGQNFQSDIYNAAFMIPDLLFFLIAGGALSSAFIPVFTEKITHGQEREAWHVFSVVASVMTLIVSLFILVGMVLTEPLVRLLNFGFSDLKVEATVPLTRIVLPSQLCFFLGGLLMGTQYARNRFLIPAIGPLIYNMGIILGGLLLGGRIGVAGLCWGALGGAIVGNFGLQWWAVWRSGMHFRPSLDWRHPDVMKVWRLMLPVILGLALPQVSVIVNRMFATTLGDGPLSAISNANRLMQVPLGIFAQTTGIAIFPTLSAMAAKKEWLQLRSTASMGIRFILFLTLPCSLFIIVLARPIVALILQHGKFLSGDTLITATALIFYSIGIFAWSAQAVLSRVFYAMQDSRTPVLIGTGVTLLFIPLNWLLMTPLGMGYAGLALATTIAASLHMFITLMVLRRRLNGIEGGRLLLGLGRTLLASLGGALACYGALYGLESYVGAVHLSAHVKAHSLQAIAAGLAAGGAVYLLCALLLRSEELGQALSLLRRRRRSESPE
jgi:putative peptidoglycan lipid II flippase